MQTNRTNALELPAAIASYFANETSDSEAVARCFTEDALVVDERHEHRGRAAIAVWNAGATTTYSFATEPLAVERCGAHTTVRARVTGNVSSAIELRFRFTLERDLIARLEIAP